MDYAMLISIHNFEKEKYPQGSITVLSQLSQMNPSFFNSIIQMTHAQTRSNKSSSPCSFTSSVSSSYSSLSLPATNNNHNQKEKKASSTSSSSSSSSTLSLSKLVTQQKLITIITTTLYIRMKKQHKKSPTSSKRFTRI